jgi:HAD superfamily hydrolase (TIGR01662 family)
LEIKNSNVITYKFGNPKSDKLAIFDRDGTLNLDSGYTSEISRITLTGFAEKLKTLFEEFQFDAAIASNQSGIGRGLYTAADFINFTDHLCREIDRDQRNFFVYVACEHVPLAGCSCRKPNPSQLLYITSLKTYKNSVFLGNAESDRLAADLAKIDYIDATCDDAVDYFQRWLEQ